MKRIFLSIVVLACSCMSMLAQSYKTLDDIQIRDPFIYADQKGKAYYLYQTRDTIIDGKTYGGVIAWQSKDLKRWTGPKRVFTCPSDNYLSGYVWAPEMHAYKGKYYLFLTLNSDVEWKAQAPGWQKYLSPYSTSDALQLAPRPL